jgi:hypothetical protein
MKADFIGHGVISVFLVAKKDCFVERQQNKPHQR